MRKERNKQPPFWTLQRASFEVNRKEISVGWWKVFFFSYGRVSCSRVYREIRVSSDGWIIPRGVQLSISTWKPRRWSCARRLSRFSFCLPFLLLRRHATIHNKTLYFNMGNPPELTHQPLFPMGSEQVVGFSLRRSLGFVLILLISIHKH